MLPAKLQKELVSMEAFNAFIKAESSFKVALGRIGGRKIRDLRTNACFRMNDLVKHFSVLARKDGKLSSEKREQALQSIQTLRSLDQTTDKEASLLLRKKCAASLIHHLKKWTGNLNYSRDAVLDRMEDRFLRQRPTLIHPKTLEIPPEKPETLPETSELNIPKIIITPPDSPLKSSQSAPSLLRRSRPSTIKIERTAPLVTMEEVKKEAPLPPKIEPIDLPVKVDLQKSIPAARVASPVHAKYLPTAAKLYIETLSTPPDAPLKTQQTKRKSVFLGILKIEGPDFDPANPARYYDPSSAEGLMRSAEGLGVPPTGKKKSPINLKNPAVLQVLKDLFRFGNENVRDGLVKWMPMQSSFDSSIYFEVLEVYVQKAAQEESFGASSLLSLLKEYKQLWLRSSNDIQKQQLASGKNTVVQAFALLMELDVKTNGLEELMAWMEMKNLIDKEFCKSCLLVFNRKILSGIKDDWFVRQQLLRIASSKGWIAELTAEGVMC